MVHCLLSPFKEFVGFYSRETEDTDSEGDDYTVYELLIHTKSEGDKVIANFPDTGYDPRITSDFEKVGDLIEELIAGDTNKIKN